MPRYKLVDGVRVQLTSEEETARDLEEQQWNEGAFDRKMTSLREQRNSLLTQTDYLALSDQTMSTEMTTYRQALRDITNGLSTVEDVEAVEFPERPEA
jgi:hypothetical protein